MYGIVFIDVTGITAFMAAIFLIHSPNVQKNPKSTPPPSASSGLQLAKFTRAKAMNPRPAESSLAIAASQSMLRNAPAGPANVAPYIVASSCVSL